MGNGNQNLMRGFGKYVAKMLRQDWDWWTIISGQEGVGKSTCAIWWAHYVSGPLFKIDMHIAYDPEEFLELIDSAPMYGSIIADEGGEMWFNRDFATTYNKALAKASQQIRDRRLNIIICVPSVFLLDTSAIRRHKTWVHCTAPNMQRGKSEWYKPIWKKYAKETIPFWDLKFVHYFQPLPLKQERIYSKIKSEKAKERIERYLEQLKKQRREQEGDQLDAHEILRRITEKKNIKELMNSKGKVDRDLIRYYYGCNASIARQVAQILNRKMQEQES